MNILEALKVMEIVKGFIRITDHLRSHDITEKLYIDEIKPMLVSFRSFLNSVSFDLDDNSILPYNSFERVQLRSESEFVDEVLTETIKLLEKDIVKEKG